MLEGELALSRSEIREEKVSVIERKS